MSTTPPRPPSGTQFELRHGPQRVVVTEVGAGLREYTVDGRAVLDGYPEDEMCSGGRGQTLIPWPNRVDGGRYSFPDTEHADTEHADTEHADTEHQLAWTEPARGNAIHGLTRWVNWTATRHTEDELRMAHTVHAQQGWPFLLACELRFRLTEDGLAVTTTARNVGAGPCPYATGAHPYLTVGTATVDSVVVSAPGGVCYPTDERGIPTGRMSVVGTGYDLRTPATLGERVLDTAYTELERDPDGLARVRLSAPDGGGVTLWQDGGYGYLQLFTGDTLPVGRRRAALAVEPMTAAPNALRSGDGLVVLRPGEAHEASWGITPS